MPRLRGNSRRAAPIYAGVPAFHAITDRDSSRRAMLRGGFCLFILPNYSVRVLFIVPIFGWKTPFLLLFFFSYSIMKSTAGGAFRPAKKEE